MLSAHSPSGGLWCYVQANGAITDHRLVMIGAGFQARVVTSGSLVHGSRLGATLESFNDNEYGWVQIWGPASVAGGGTVSAGAALTLDASDSGRVITATTNTPQTLGLHANEALVNGTNGPVQLNFPVNLS